MNLPALSVVIPLFNKGAHVAAALRSVLDQEGVNLEVVVIDDGSTDGGAQVVAAMGDARIRLEQQANAGVSVARNRGIALARAEFVAFLDADDKVLPEHYLGLLSAAAQFPDRHAYCSGYQLISADGRARKMSLAMAAPQLVRDFYREWSRGAFTHTNSVMVRRSTLMAMAPAFAVGERLGEDQDLWFRLAETVGFVHVPRCLTMYRIGVSGAATTGVRVLAPLPAYLRLAQRLVNGEVPAPMRAGAARLLASHLLNVARERLAVGDNAGARALIDDPRARANGRYWMRTAAKARWHQVFSRQGP